MVDNHNAKVESRITQAVFVKSSKVFKGCPESDIPEHAFIGRSNVGKSSLINMLAERRKLAFTSSTPGKTQLINHFLIDKSWYLADLPGYGYAKVSKSVRKEWPTLIKNYLLNRKNLLNTFILVDVRIEPQDVDLSFFRWMGQESLPFAIVFTKSDKLSGNKLNVNIERYKKVLLNEWEFLPPVFVTSALTGAGRKELLKFILDTNTVFLD